MTIARALLLLCLFTQLLVLGSCKTSQLQQTGIAWLAGDNKFSNNKVFDCCRVRFRATVKAEGRPMPATGMLQVVDGKWMSCSMRSPFLGMEILRIEADNDTLLVINRRAKCYAKIPMAAIEERTGLDYASLQSLMMNDCFSITGTPHSPDYCNDVLNAGKAACSETHGSTNLSFVIDDYGRVVKSIVETQANYSLEFGYGDFQFRQGNYYPGSITIDVSGGHGTAAVSLSCTNFDFSFFEPAPVTVSSRYDELSLNGIMSMLNI